jgi:hypothetical protein
MADVLSASCDICDVLKGRANHWYRVWKANSAIGIAPWSLDIPDKHFHACGEVHALQLAARLLGKPAALPDSTTDQANAGANL